MGTDQLHATTRDVLLAIWLFLGPPAGVFVTCVVRELWRLRGERYRARHDARAMHDEGYPPGAPVECSEQTDR